VDLGLHSQATEMRERGTRSRSEVVGSIIPG
jgi:hypothetical protein